MPLLRTGVFRWQQNYWLEHVLRLPGNPVIPGGLPHFRAGWVGPPQVAQFKATVLLMANGSDRVTSSGPLQKLETDKKARPSPLFPPFRPQNVCGGARYGAPDMLGPPPPGWPTFDGLAARGWVPGG